MSELRPSRIVLLIGGPSGVGKTTAAAEVARRLAVPWLMVDDLRLALGRSGVSVPDADAVLTFDAPGGLVALGELMTPAIEVVVENHVDQGYPVVIEGDGILPSLFDRDSVRTRVARRLAYVVFLDEPDEDALHANMLARRRGLSSREHAHKSFRFGQWIRTEAERRGLPIVIARPWHTLPDRILAAASCSLPAS